MDGRLQCGKRWSQRAGDGDSSAPFPNACTLRGHSCPWTIHPYPYQPTTARTQADQRRKTVAYAWKTQAPQVLQISLDLIDSGTFVHYRPAAWSLRRFHYPKNGHRLPSNSPALKTLKPLYAGGLDKPISPMGDLSKKGLAG